jgi:hypothetical protein
VNPPKPTALKILNGSAKHNPDRINDAEPQPAVAVIRPPWLPKTGIASREFDRLAARFARLRVMTEADGESLALGCMALAEYLAMKDGDGWRQADAARRVYLTTLGKFGGNPSDRTRVKVADDAAEDPLDALLKKAGSG